MNHFRDYIDFLNQLPTVPMRLQGFGTNLALFLDSWAFTDMLDDKQGGPVSRLNSKMLETFNCLADKLDNLKEPTGFSILGDYCLLYMYL